MIEWPSVLKPRTIEFVINGQAVSGGRSITGRDQRVYRDAGYWVATLSDFPVVDKERARAWRSMIAKMDGGAVTVEVPVIDCAYRLTASINGWPFINGQPHSDGTFFTDGTGYDESWEVILPFRLTADAALRATSISIELDDPDIDVSMVEGVYFSIGARLHLVTGVEETGPRSWEITFRPPLRAAAATGAGVNFFDPSCEMMLSDAGAGALPLELARFSFPSLRLIEAI